MMQYYTGESYDTKKKMYLKASPGSNCAHARGLGGSREVTLDQHVGPDYYDN